MGGKRGKKEKGDADRRRDYGHGEKLGKGGWRQEENWAAQVGKKEDIGGAEKEGMTSAGFVRPKREEEGGIFY
jgi:hypothetical protein